MTTITKKFGDFVANDAINLKVHRGEVHALLGENGAGKTTLMNILYGILQPTSGTIRINGRELKVTDPNVAIRHGIGMVHQHFMLVETFTVTENIVLGNEPTRSFGVLDMETAEREVAELSERYGLAVDPKALIQDLSVGSQQRVEILKTLYRGAEILILDEPTAVLTPLEIQELVGIIRNLTEAGKSIIIITHKLGEIKQVADFCTIIRRGLHVDTVDVNTVSEAELAAKMVGREVSFKVEKKKQVPGETILEIQGLCVEGGRGLPAVDGLDLKLRKGEILGIAGVDGNGQSELIEALTGLRKVKSGSIIMRGKNITNLSPGKIIEEHKIAHIPEDRQKRGLVFEFDIAENLILQSYGKPPFSKRFSLLWDNIYQNAERLIEKFDIRPQHPATPARALSGGNQQKMIIAREVSHEPELLIAAQPTRGLDVGAIEYVHRALVAERDRGKAVLLISFELDEVLNVSDRIAVIYEGKIVGILDAEGVDENEVGLLMAGGTA
ncbi:ABC transporter ATP-binding protein [Desulfopila aestuarii]|uniref:Simple sugar transport system ATP-binding protein n=1 Tax=Desulfopila aestuarii DSM 18488 TaxID=1121416 RepID=A0A1M7YID1_9BACT|nr:simple sugar transport system ATP-binding protein [Desulfopila aestuarii DSM 18488]